MKISDFPRIVFFGTPDFAVASLKKLTDSGYSVVAVVTAPDKPSGRGLHTTSSAVKQFALANSIPVLQPVNMKDPAFRDQLAAFHPDMQIVIAFRMMPRQIWDLPPMGTFNLHASLLPQYRGAAPINWAIINGETETGVTTFFLNEHIDEGNILLSEKVVIGKDETAGELHDRLMQTGSELVVKTVNAIVSESLKAVEQLPMTGIAPVLKTAPKIFREDCQINWNQPVDRVYNFIRGLSPYPGGYTHLMMPDGTTQSMKILRAVPEITENQVTPGEIYTDGKSYIKIGAKNGIIRVNEVQMQGRKSMQSVDFLRGSRWFSSETRAI